MSFIGGELKTNFRHLIASANAKDLSAFNPESSNWDMYFYHLTLFLVLDIYTIVNKTQIFFLEIPSTEIDFFCKYDF